MNTLALFAKKIYAYTFFTEALPIFTVTALFLQNKNFSISAISFLFAIWAGARLITEIPSGVLADRMPRRRLLLISQLLTMGGISIWIIDQNFVSIATGFILWGVGRSFESGTFEAYLYDELKEHQKEKLYVKIYGRLSSAALMASLFSSLAAALLLFVWQNYEVILFGSILSAALGFVTALTLPHQKAQHKESSSFRSTALDGLKTLVKKPSIRWVFLAAILVGAIKGGLDDFHNLLLVDRGLSVEYVPLIYAGMTLLAALTSAFAYKVRAPKQRSLRGLVVLIGLVIAIVGASPLLFTMGMLLVLGSVDGLFRVHNDSRFQDQIGESSRATLISAVGFGTEGFAALLFLFSGILTTFIPLPAIYFGAAGILFVLAIIPLTNKKPANM